MVSVYPHAFGLAINPDSDDPNLVELRDRLVALEAFGAVPRCLNDLVDTHLKVLSGPPWSWSYVGPTQQGQLSSHWSC